MLDYTGLLRLLSLLSLLALMPTLLVAQSEESVRGRVIDVEGAPVVGASVLVEGTGRGGATDVNGEFAIQGVPTGPQRLVVNSMGYLPLDTTIVVSRRMDPITLQLVAAPIEEGDVVVVTGTSKQDRLRESGYAVEVIETEPRKNLTTDVNQMLGATSGVHIRETGGLGSSFSLSMNGLSGNQIRYFIDGVPMENFGSALSLDNYPVNLVENIEVYKGVVPITLGADALGGAVNITTGYRGRSYADLSWSVGSFNTHRGAVHLQYANGTIFARLSSFFNHSANSYRMDSMPIYDPELGNRSGSIDIDRFHDDYTSAMGHLEIGLLDRSFADRLSLGVTGAFNRKNHQHPSNNADRVFGDLHTRNSTLLFSANWGKEFERLDLDAYILTGRIVESTIDTSSRKYNWAGEFITRPESDPKGELFERRSHQEFTDAVVRGRLGAAYRLGAGHELGLSYTHGYLERTGEDYVNEFNRSFESPNFIHRPLLGLAWSYTTEDELLRGTAFAKEYWYRGRIITFDYQDNEVITEPSFNSTGYGAAASWRVMPELLLKTSFEKTYRIPESYEILGDGIYVRPNQALEPETSINGNFGVRVGREFGSVRVASEINGFYRSSTDFIRFAPLGPFGTYENLENVRTTGVEGSVEINFDDLLQLNTSLTSQDLRDRTEFDEGLPNTNYRSRIPNTPWLFGNARLGLNLGKLLGPEKLTLYWSTHYVHDFFLTWEELGSSSSKNVIPTQLTHGLQIDYGILDTGLNISLSVSNLTDARAYDNFNVQKPGRGVYVKLRYSTM